MNILLLWAKIFFYSQAYASLIIHILVQLCVIFSTWFIYKLANIVDIFFLNYTGIVNMVGIVLVFCSVIQTQMRKLLRKVWATEFFFVLFAVWSCINNLCILQSNSAKLFSKYIRNMCSIFMDRDLFGVQTKHTFNIS